MSTSTDTPIEIRPIEENDWSILRDVRLRALANAPLSFGSSLAHEVTFEEPDWIAVIKRGRWFIAFSKYTPVGVIGGLNHLAQASNEVHLTSFWVDPLFRQFGVGSSLLSAITAWARSMHAARLTLWVSDQSSVACQFYLRKGFVDTGARQPLPSSPSIGEGKLSLNLWEATGCEMGSTTDVRDEA